MTIWLTNTATRTKEEFTPLDPDNVRMYVCGPTVYDRAHIGNARPVIVFDVLYRLLRHVYGAEHVTYVRNFTDVDDKINARAADTGRSIGDITEETTRWYLEDMAAIGALEPTHMPRATAYITEMIAMIEDLIAKGHAYEAEGHVLFAVDSWKDGYGKLSGRTVDDMIAGARVEVAPYKRNPMDFVMWKPSSDDQPGWHSPWGRGRPGWHIECSAMAHDLLGDQFDIHGGGNDLMFPHHENEIAQSKCAGHGFARYWLHNEMLQVEGKKMSKSLGNFFTIRDLLDQGVPGEVIRFVFLSTHYRKPMDWTAEKVRQAEETLVQWRKMTEFVLPTKPSKKVVQALSDDLNTPLALAELEQIAARKDAGALKASAMLIGLLSDDAGAWSWKQRPIRDFRQLPDWHPATTWLAEVTKPIADIAQEMSKATDNLRGIKIPELNFDIKIPKVQIIKPEIIEGIKRLGEYHERLKTEFPDELELLEYAALSELRVDRMTAIKNAGIVALVRDRDAAKKARDFNKADEIRNELDRLGFELVDTKDGPKLFFLKSFDEKKLESLS